ncbi:hypothetical protein PVMG_02553 [Plasmodium vivax Mauritania I]|uniref:Variable surface protein Vir35 n=1 Tax=Plasmodium vivax Mauritania I TaxID=1035515 RepID=A0A0J9THH5_PLAVI|nr:hypothetical protein PVMG_02553 [Plasmodium vivax Mauritania I]
MYILRNLKVSLKSKIIVLQCYINMQNYKVGNNLGNLYSVEKKSVIGFQRSLAKNVPKKELDRSRKGPKLLERDPYSNIKCTSDDLSKYTQLKKKGLNNLDLYKKLYKHRYSKKNVLGKFDCYCEKKIFDKFDYINELKEKLRHDKKSFNKNLNKIFDIPLILFGLFPLIGFIIPLLKIKNYEIIQGCFSDCKDKKHYEGEDVSKPHLNDKSNKLSISESAWNTITYVDLAFTCIAVVIVVCVVLYIFLKMLKYKKLKAGKDKMSLKEYYHFFNTRL